MNACPTYLELGTEADSPRGRIYLMRGLKEGTVSLAPEVREHLDLCLGCRACETACPSGVRFGRLIESARERAANESHRPWYARWRDATMLSVFPYPNRLRLLLLAVRLLQRAGVWRLLRRRVPLCNLVPDLRSPTSTEPLRDGPPNGRGRVALFTGCVTSVMFPRVNDAARRVLARNGYSAEAPSGQGCCGALHLHAGDRSAARRLARANVDAFSDREGPIVVTAAGCGALLKEYDALLADDPDYAQRARAFAGRVTDATEFLADRLTVMPERRSEFRVTYHDPCHLAHAQGVRAQPRSLLARLPGVEFVELGDADLCCGSAGSYSLTQRDMATRLMRRKIDRIAATGASCVATANPGCALQIEAGLRDRGLEVRVVHVLELFDEAYRGEKADEAADGGAGASRLLTV